MSKLAPIILLIFAITSSAPQKAYGCSSEFIGMTGDGLCFMGIRWNMTREEVLRTLESNNQKFGDASTRQGAIIPNDNRERTEFLKKKFLVRGQIKSGDDIDFLISSNYGEKYAIVFRFKSNLLYSIFIIPYHDSNRINTISLKDSLSDANSAFSVEISGFLKPKAYIGDITVHRKNSNYNARVYKNYDTISTSIIESVLWNSLYDMSSDVIVYEFNRVKNVYGEKTREAQRTQNKNGYDSGLHIDLRLKERKDTVDSLLN